jgi:hypothetical protein
VQVAQQVAEHPRLAETLRRVVDAANIALPAKAKIAALVCSGRSRPKVIAASLIRLTNLIVTWRLKHDTEVMN